MIGDQPIQFGDSLAEGTATPELGEITRTIRACEFVFDVPLFLHLNFSVPLLAESYEGSASLHLRLTAAAYEPAFLYLKAKRVQETDILADAEADRGWGLAQKLGTQGDWFDKLVRGKIKAEINARLRVTRYARLIDLSTLAAEAYSGNTDPHPALRPEDPASIIPSDFFLPGTLEPRVSHWYAVMLSAEEQVNFHIYTAAPEYGLVARGRFELQTASGKVIEGTGCPLTTESGWLGDYRLHECSFRAPETGVYRFRLHNEEHISGHLIHYRVRQERLKPEVDEAVCYNELGPQLMRHIVSAPLIQHKLKSLLPPSKHFGPLNLLPLTTAEGDAPIQILSVEPDRPRRRQADRELAYKLLLHIAPDVSVTVLGMQERWHLETRVTVRLRVHAFTSPLSIQIDPDEVTVAAVKTIEATCVQGAGHFNDFNLLTRNVAQPLVAQIKEILRETEPARAIDIESLVAQAIARPNSAPSSNLSSAIHARPLSKTIDNRSRAGQMPQYYSLYLKARQKLQLKLRWLLTTKPTRPFRATLAVCDAHQGLVKSEPFSVGEAGKSGHVRLALTAPRSGNYRFRVRVEPSKSTAPLALDYQVTVTVL